MYIYIIYIYIILCARILCSRELYFLLQPESQEKISHSQLTSDYPRYPSVFKASKGLTPADRLMLMVRTDITQCDEKLRT